MYMYQLELKNKLSIALHKMFQYTVFRFITVCLFLLVAENLVTFQSYRKKEITAVISYSSLINYILRVVSNGPASLRSFQFLPTRYDLGQNNKKSLLTHYVDLQLFPKYHFLRT